MASSISEPSEPGRGKGFNLVFPTGQDSATFQDKGTGVSSFSRDKGTTGQAQNLAMGREGSAKFQDRTRNETGQSLFFPIISCFITSFLFLEHTSSVLERTFPVLEPPFGKVILSRDFCCCPCLGSKGHQDKKISLFRDKGTTGRPVPRKG